MGRFFKNCLQAKACGSDSVARNTQGPRLTRVIRAVGFRRRRKSRLTQISCVGAHRRAPYNPLTNRDLWAHICAPLHASIKIKQSFATPSLAHGPTPTRAFGNDESEEIPESADVSLP